MVCNAMVWLWLWLWLWLWHGMACKIHTSMYTEHVIWYTPKRAIELGQWWWYTLYLLYLFALTHILAVWTSAIVQDVLLPKKMVFCHFFQYKNPISWHLPEFVDRRIYSIPGHVLWPGAEWHICGTPSICRSFSKLETIGSKLLDQWHIATFVG